MTESVLLVGYMGSGKTKIGKKIAKKLSLDFYDLDSEIENEFSIPISKIFDKIGELSFRKIEKSKLEKILSFKKPFVLSVGGGTPCYFDNMRLMNEKVKYTIFLDVKPKILADRLFTRKSKRPLISKIQSIDEMTEYVSKHLFERYNYYKLAKFRVEPNLSNSKKTADKIIKLLK
tara:strand:- start:222 stop:746 length:525 start_codon:yes stop_codon:yes gene_type:complete